MADLEPCMLCGKPAELSAAENPDARYAFERCSATVKCSDSQCRAYVTCWASSMTDALESAVKRWNRRAE